MKRIGILLSGRGSNFEALANNVQSRQLACEIALVFSNRAEAHGLARAREMGLRTACIPSAGRNRSEFDSEVAALLQQHQVDLVCLAGYMRLLTGGFVSQFPERILNIHPSLLPSFPGLDAQHQALVHGVKFSGCTVHFVDEHLDGGPILIQAVVPVLDEDTTDTLSARILAEEHRIYSEAVAWVFQGNYKIDGRRVLKT